MTTMRKSFRNEVQSYILSELENIGTNRENMENAVQHFETYRRTSFRRDPGRKEAFISWIQGLPTQLSVDYTTYGQEEKVLEWFTKSGHTWSALQYTPELFWHLIYREFVQICKDYGIELKF